MLKMATVRVLLRVFAKEFYKVHAGQILFLFGVFLSYMLYIQVLSDDHLSLTETIFYNLSFAITVLSSPMMAVLIMGLFLVYTLKSFKFVSEKLKNNQQLFLFYSTTASAYPKQFFNWLFVQVIISLPIFVYVIFIIIIGICYDYYLVPIVITCFIISISILCVWLYLKKINSPMSVYNENYLFLLSKKLKKTLSIIPILFLLHKELLSTIMTKVVSTLLIISMLHFFNDFNFQSLGALIAIFCAVSNVVLVLKMAQFENLQMKFILNFPTSYLQIYKNWFLTLFFLVLPETLFLGYHFSLLITINACLILISMLLLFRSILLKTITEIKWFLKIVGFLCLVSVLLILFKLHYLLGLLCLIISFINLKRLFYHQI